jgi:cysteine desulfurase
MNDIINKIYFDNQSNTVIDKRVFDAMVPFFNNYFWNSQSIHSLGSFVKKSIEISREQISCFLNANSSKIIFTSCATESNNLIIKGISNVMKNKGKHVIVSKIEHFSILNSLSGLDVTYISVDKHGFVNEDELKKSIRKDTVLVSIQYANPEIGVIQDIKKLCSIVKNNTINDCVVFHTDAVSACGMINIDFDDLNIDALTISSSVIHGPVGVAALCLKKNIHITSEINGGTQEYNIRSGTENVPAIIGFGKICEFLNNEIEENCYNIKKKRDLLLDGIFEKIKYVYLNGPDKIKRLCCNVNFSVEFVEGESLVLFLDLSDIIVSTGSSCANKNLKISHVLNSININTTLAQGSVVFSLSKFNNIREIEYTLNTLPIIVKKLRDTSPLYSYFIKKCKRKS